MVDGIRIPVVTSTRDLRVPIHTSTNMSFTVRTRNVAFQRAGHAAHALLRDRDMPLLLRVAAYRTYVRPVGTFGGEIFGAERQTTLQPLVETEARHMSILLFGFATKWRHAYAPAFVELGLVPLQGSLQAFWARAHAKFPTLASQISGLMTATYPADGAQHYPPSTWALNRSHRTRITQLTAGTDMGGAAHWTACEPKRLAKVVQREWLRSWLATQDSQAWHRYNTADYQRTRFYLHTAATTTWAHTAAQVSTLTLARVGALHTSYTAAQMKQHGLLTPHKDHCTSCGRAWTWQSQWSHILLCCPHHVITQRRAELLAPAVTASMAIIGNARWATCTNDQRCTLLLGGTVTLQHGAGNMRLSLGKAWMGSVKRAAQARTPIFIHVARYLHAAMVVHSSTWSARAAPVADTDDNSDTMAPLLAAVNAAAQQAMAPQQATPTSSGARSTVDEGSEALSAAGEQDVAMDGHDSTDTE